ncbi:MAG: hypothetical protein AABY22_01950 [Nanoarchaeota archaeon]
MIDEKKHCEETRKDVSQMTKRAFIVGILLGVFGTVIILLGIMVI